MLVDELSFEYCAILQTFYINECRDSLLWTVTSVADRSKSASMAFKSLADMSSRNVYDYSSSIEALLIKLKIGDSWLMVCAAYRPPSIRGSIWMNKIYISF